MVVNILNLDGWEVVAVEEHGNDYLVRARYPKEPTVCRRCGVVEPKVYKFGVREQTYLDTPIHGKPTALLVERQRFRCRECNQVFMQDLPHMEDGHQMTRRLWLWVGQKSLTHPFAEVHRLCGLDERTVRRVFDEYIELMDWGTTFVTPEWLGIDEVVLRGVARLVLANVDKGTLIGLYPNRLKQTVYDAIRALPERERVRIVTIDMTPIYRDASRELLPNATVVVDKFHVVKKASEAFEEIRKRVKKGLTERQRRTLKGDRGILRLRRGKLKPHHAMLVETWGNAFPLLGEAYRVREEFYNVYDAPDRGEAERRFEVWAESIPKPLKTPKLFGGIVHMVRRWHPEIFAYFDHNATNAFTERLNGEIKLMNRRGRGYTFEILRAKILYGTEHLKLPSPLRRRLKERELDGAVVREVEHAFGPPWEDDGMWDYGVPLSTLQLDHGRELSTE